MLPAILFNVALIASHGAQSNASNFALSIDRPSHLCVRSRMRRAAVATARAVGRGELLMVATPIGNLGDLSLRAAQALSDAALIMAEDTRVARKLLSAHGISLAGRELLSCDEHKQRERLPTILARLRAGEQVALVSDAGTPGISDPGAEVAAAARAAGARVTPIPGPSACIAALSCAGIPMPHGFLFKGFPPRAGPARAAHLAHSISAARGPPATGRVRQGTAKPAAAAEVAACHPPVPVVLYEAPHRLHATLEALAALDRASGGSHPLLLTVCRELTKMNEQVVTFVSCAAALQAAGDPTSPPEQAALPALGEIVLILHAAMGSEVG
jgi:16S rRNA (cytidine1402-2'-O)-methyltransferase